MGKIRKAGWWKFIVFFLGLAVVSQLPDPWRLYVAAIFGMYILSTIAQFFEAMNDKLDEIIDLLNAHAPNENSFD